MACTLVIIETNGTVKNLKAKDVTLDTLYKKCGFRSSEDFGRQHTWEVNLAGEKHIVSVWAKKVGKANFENKYDFPPPVDTVLFFGTCAIVRTDEEGNLIGLAKETWEKIYEKLFGGFEDIGDEDEFSEDELAGVDPSLLTAHGYLKDEFVVSDSDPSPVTTPPPPSKKTTLKKKAAAAAAVVVVVADETESSTESELEEEVYTFEE